MPPGISWETPGFDFAILGGQKLKRLHTVLEFLSASLVFVPVTDLFVLEFLFYQGDTCFIVAFKNQNPAGSLSDRGVVVALTATLYLTNDWHAGENN